MLQIKNISKQYKTGDLVQNALSGVSLNLRDNEFVSILGPSGSGKTTLLNIIGGLDRYDSGDLIINGISTKEYKDRDWDAYRNHTIGFVFQSYNLIPHQSIPANVELALTIGGISRSERRERAKKALAEVGLGDQLHKKPNQMSGGQMQRVAIARALVNNPDILLADEPTGALDTETSIQVMELLKKVAKDRLVVMVTHNPELAEQYSTRIVKLRDGKIIDDSNHFTPGTAVKKPENTSMGKAKMSFLTSLSLSFNNLRTKKGRTILTAFAGSIGIIGIALILSLSNGVNQYIEDIQRDTMASYPITISSQAVDMSSVMGNRGGRMQSGEAESGSSEERSAVYADYSAIEQSEAMADRIRENNLTAFKNYLEDQGSEIRQYLGENGVVYTYNVGFSVYSYDADGNLIASDADVDAVSDSTLSSENSAAAGGPAANMQRMSSAMSGSNSSGAENFAELMAAADGETVSPILTESYDLLYGTWPENYDEVILVLDEQNQIPADSLYQLGFLTGEEYQELTEEIKEGKDAKERIWNYEEICSRTFYMVPACELYEEQDGIFQYVGDDALKVEPLLEKGVKLKITGIIQPAEDAENANISATVGYTSKLTDYIIEHTDSSPVVLAQEKTPEINVLNGLRFEAESDAQKAYNENMTNFGKVSYDAPASISIYTDSFEDKEAVSACIEHYNEGAEEKNQITYTDYVELLTSSITSIVDVISYVLIAFVAVSLIVSSIMIGIITHISVLERTKEIGILRAMGASKRNISQVFNAETIIIGLFAGVLGVGVTMLLTIPINSLLQNLLGAATLSAALPVSAALLLIVLSMAITIVAGLIPARAAAKKDPVLAFRSE